MALATGLGLTTDNDEQQQQQLPGQGAAPGAPAENSLAPTLQPSLDPNAQSPYQPLSMPTVEAGPTVASALPPEQEPQHLGAASTAGQFAYMADKLLRGAAQGFDLAQRQKAAQAQKKVTALRSLYDDSAKQYRDLVQAGVDPNSDQFKAAHNRMMASWQAMMDTVGSQLPQQQMDKNGKPKKDSRPLLQRMFQAENPTDALQAWYQVSQQLGPPVLHETAPMLTDAYRAKVQQRARTAGTTAQTAELTAQNQAELQQLLAKPNPTQDDQDRIMLLKYGIGKSTNLPQTMVWRPLTGSKPFLGQDGQYFQTMTNAVGQTQNRALPAGYVPPPDVLKGLARNREENGVWYTYNVDQQGNEIPGTAKPISAAVAAGPTNTTSQIVKLVTQPDGSQVPMVVQQTSTRTHGAAPGAPGAPAGTVAPQSGQTGQPGTTALEGQPQQQSLAASAPASHSPAHTSAAPHGAGVISQGAPVGGRLPQQEVQSLHAMEDTLPVLDRTMKMLEPAKDEGSLLDAINQRIQYGGYKAGFNMGALQTAINQYAAFVRVAGASPWSKVGRGKYIYEQIVEHLPDPSKDTPSLMYQKLADLKQIFNTEMGAVKGRMAAMNPGAAGQQSQGQGQGQGQGQSTPQAATTPTPAPAPTAQTHQFNITLWKQANPHGNAAAAEAAARKRGFEVVR